MHTHDVSITDAKGWTDARICDFSAGLQSRDPVCIRPGIGSGDAGVSRIDTAEDLMAYSEVLRDRLDAIPALALSWGNLELKMPRQPCPHYYLEPFTAANRYSIAHPSLSWHIL